MNMSEVDHTHPHTDEPFGSQYYADAVAADGGTEQETVADGEQETMVDVDHEPPTDGTVRTFERGSEGREKTV